MKLLLALLLTLIAAPPLNAQTPVWQDQLDELFEEWWDEDQPGVMLYIERDGQVQYAQGYGLANIKDEIAHGPDLLFNIASVSKQFTAASIALLSLQDRLDLEADIRSILPDLPKFESTIRVRHLIHHTSGLPEVLDMIQDEEDDYPDGWGNAEALDYLHDNHELLFDPGDEFEYCNTNYLLLSEIVEQVSGQSLRQFVREQIFDPLNMPTARVDDSLGFLDHPGRVRSYRRRRGEYHRIPRIDSATGDGNVVVSVREFARWSRNFHTHQLGGDRLQQLLLTRGHLNNGKVTNYAFGINVEEHAGRPCLLHGGSWLGYRSFWGCYPEDKTTILIFANHNRSRLYQDEVAQIYFDAHDE